MTLAAILLAAGRSERFGAQDKLLADYRGAPLVSYAADALRDLSPDVLIAVTGSDRVAAILSDFTIVSPNGPGTGLSDSLRAGISTAHEHGVDRVLVVLGGYAVRHTRPPPGHRWKMLRDNGVSRNGWDTPYAARLLSQAALAQAYVPVR